MPLRLRLLFSVAGADINGSSVAGVGKQHVATAEQEAAHRFAVRISSNVIALVTVRNNALFPIRVTHDNSTILQITLQLTCVTAIIC